MVISTMALILALQSCIPRSIFISFEEDKADVRVDAYYDYSTQVFHEDTTHSGVPIDSISKYILTCDQEAFLFSDSAETVFVKFAGEVTDPPAVCVALHPQIILQFNKPVTRFSGPTKGLGHTSDRKTFYLPDSPKQLLRNQGGYRFSTDTESEPNFTHPFGLKYFGFVIDPLPGVGLAWGSGNSKRVFGDGLFLNFGLAFIMNDFRAIMRLAYFDFNSVRDIPPDPIFTGVSAGNLEFGLGYELLNTEFFTFIPNFFGGRKSFRFYDSDGAADRIGTDQFYTYGAGLTLDFKLHQLLRTKAQREAKKGEYFYLKFDAGWYPELFREPFNISGSVTYFTVGIAGYFGGPNEVRRVKMKR
ncbi:MAG: hypothetical protein LC670_03555 [Flavobacteriales bacterium]|nr:hypothetical protein [Flavobacteriales bacterium]